MSATVEVGRYGFEVWDDFGPEGRRSCYGTDQEGRFGVLTFHSRFDAQRYAYARGVHAEHFAKHEYGNDEWEKRDDCKQLAKRGRVYESV